MNSYITGAVIRRLREQKGLTQAELAVKIDVSSKAVSKWETAKGLPDISLLEPLSQALGVSVLELLSGDAISNQNKAANLLRSRLYVCPICGNVIHTMGDAVISCCGVSLPALEAEEPDDSHHLTLEPVEDETFVALTHPMTKSHYISFLAYVTTDRFQMVKLYPEGSAGCRFRFQGPGYLYCFCNRHGLMRQRVGWPAAPRDSKGSVPSGV